ncbi:AAA family ATPase [Leuconostoc lactis]
MPTNTETLTKAKTVITVDLTKQAYPVFNDANLELANKNFIFGKNGAGKSTLVQLIKDQMSESYNVYAFQGFSKLLGTNENLDAFSLAVDAGDNENRIQELEKNLVQEREKLENAEHELIPIAEDTPNLLSKKIAAEAEYDGLYRDIHNHKVKLASSIKNKKDPQIAPPTYNIKRLEEEELNAALLQDSDVNQMTKILRSEMLDSLDIVSFKSIDFSDILMKTNDVLRHSIKEKSTLARLDTEEKTEFAHAGWELHDSGEICAFCGNQITDDKYQELTNYFAADDVIKQEETV